MVKQSGYRHPPGMLMRYTYTAPAHFYGFVSKSFTCFACWLRHYPNGVLSAVFMDDLGTMPQHVAYSKSNSSQLINHRRYKIFVFFYIAILLGVFTVPTVAQMEHNINVFRNGDDVCVKGKSCAKSI
jgi:hypothetical protein